MNLKNKVLILIFAMIVSISNVSATVDFSALTDLINATFTVLNTIVLNQSTLVSIVVLFGTLGLIGIIIYGFIGKLLGKIGSMGLGKQ